MEYLLGSRDGVPVCLLLVQEMECLLGSIKTLQRGETLISCSTKHICINFLLQDCEGREKQGPGY